jgi:DNA-binding MarR family transcriptional regulator
MGGDRQRLVEVARLFGELVGIIDPLRLRLWSECGLTMPQLRLLLLMRDQPGITGSALAERFHVHPSTITGHIEKLMQRDLVHRVEDEQDRRVQHNYLTEQGAGLVGQIERTAGQFIIGLLERLSPEQVERLAAGMADLLSVANRVAIDNLDKETVSSTKSVADNS